jgi:hypothetical protein
MGTPTVYANFKLKQNNGNAIDLDTDTIKVMIVTSAYTPSASAHATKADVTNEVSGTNYTARGTAITGVTLSLSGTTALWVHNDITWTQSAGAGFSNGRTYIWYKDSGTDATSPLIMYMTEAADFGNVAGDLLLDGSAVTGVLNIS